jgi:hypothetical protein
MQGEWKVKDALPVLLRAAIVRLPGARTACADGMLFPVVPQPAPPLSVKYQRVIVSTGSQIARIHVDQAFVNDTNRTPEDTRLSPHPRGRPRARLRVAANWR